MGPSKEQAASTSPGQAHEDLPIAKRDAIGRRAMARRVALGITRLELAPLLPLTVTSILTWERCWPSKPKPAIEARWEAILGVPPGWLRDTGMETPPLPGIDVIAAAPRTVADEIRAISNWLAPTRRTRRSTSQDGLTASERRSSEIFASRYGVQGEENSTLQAIGDRYSLTRERIRQITDKLLERVRELHTAETPNLDELTKQLRDRLPSPVIQLDEQLRHLLGESLSIEGAERFGREVLGRKIVEFSRNAADMSQKHHLIAIDPQQHDPDLVRAAREASLRMIRSCGAAHLMVITGATGATANRSVTPDEILRACQTVPGFVWLKEEDGWFWYGPEWPADNRLLNVTRKVLSVCQQRIDVEELAQAFMRNRRFHYPQDRLRPILIEPPFSVIVAVLAQTPWVKVVQHDDFQLRGHLAPEETLAEVELHIYQELAACGGVSTRGALRHALIAGGRIKKDAFQVMIDSTPIVTRLDFGLFALRGWPVAASAMASALTQHERRPRAQAVPDSSGWIAFELVLKEYSVLRRIYELPGYIARALTPGPFAVEGFAEPSRYVRTQNQHRLNLFVQKLLVLGMRAGDTATIRINERDRRIIIER